MAMNSTDQFELMAAIRAHAEMLLKLPQHDIKPSTALYYADRVLRMAELVKKLDVRS